MKKIDIVNLIKSHASRDDESFRRLSYKIADDFKENGDDELHSMIYSLLSNAYTFAAQSNDNEMNFLQRVDGSASILYFPDCIKSDIVGLVHAVNRHMNINKFLFFGSPGTGKTEAAKTLSRMLKRELWVVSISNLIGSRLGETSKNISSLFESINSYKNRSKMVVLFDEIDALAMNRSDSRDIREMGRATTELFKGLDFLSSDVVLIATTNMQDHFDSALLRRFSSKINFSRYSNGDLIEVALRIYSDIAYDVEGIEINNRLFKKIIGLAKPIPYPGELKNIISTSIAFSNPTNPFDYFRRLLFSLSKEDDALDIRKLREEGFSIREIAYLSGFSKSDVSRRLTNGKKK